jgi:YfiH family protein
VSEKEHTSSLNLAFNRGDDDEIVLENLRRFGEAVGFDPKTVISLPQIHSTNVIDADISMGGEGYFKPPHTSCDGYVTTQKGVVLGVKTADCVPIILEAEDENGNVIAVSALHAGWRATVGGIAAQGVLALVEKGAKVSHIRAAIGPSIGACCFEVGDDFVSTVIEVRGTDFAGKFISDRAGKKYADLKAMNFDILKKSGVSAENIDVFGECTYCLENKYYSHRRMKGQRGTQLSVVFI